MPNYTYQLQDGSGQVMAGQLRASSTDDALLALRNQGIGRILSVKPADPFSAVISALRTVKFEAGPGLKDVQSFTNQLAVMIKAGINIRTAIASVAEQVKKPKFARMIHQIKDDVEAGHPFSDAIARYPGAFSPLYVNMVRASEMSGSFGHMLERISDHLSSQIETRNMIIGAMIYPSIIGFMAVGTTIFLLTFVLPRFLVLFEGKEDLLPIQTIMLMAMSMFVIAYWPFLVGGVISLVLGFHFGVRTKKGRHIWDTVKLKAPILGGITRALCISRSVQTMSELVTAGVPMLETLAITADVAGNVHYRRMWLNVHASVQQGQKICTVLGATTLLPKNVVQMITAGEDSGKLGEVLRDVAEFYSKELRHKIKAFTSLIEPAMILVMGVIVGFIAMSIILPIFSMSKLVK